MLKLSIVITFILLASTSSWSEEKVIKKWIDMTQEEKDAKNAEWDESMEYLDIDADPEEQEFMMYRAGLKKGYKKAYKAGNNEKGDELRGEFLNSLRDPTLIDSNVDASYDKQRYKRHMAGGDRHWNDKTKRKSVPKDLEEYLQKRELPNEGSGSRESDGDEADYSYESGIGTYSDNAER